MPQESEFSYSADESDPPLSIHGDIPVDLGIKNGAHYLFVSNDQRAYTHGIHKYPAKFFPELPRWIISRYSKVGDLILDPFMGSGTTNLEAMLLHRDSVGIDIDPFSRFLARAKTTPLDKIELRNAVRSLESHVDSFDSTLRFGSIPEFPYRENWFKSYVLNELAFIKSGIECIECSKATKDFLLVTFSSIIRQASQADNNCTRTVVRRSLGKKVDQGYAISLFRKRLTNNTESMFDLIGKDVAYVEIPTDSSATDMRRYSDETFDLVLTSPPYMNAVDYPRTHQLEMYWLGLANGSLRDLKVKHVGTEVVLATDYSTLHKTGNKDADKVIQSIYSIDRRRAFIAYKYIQDMSKNLQEVFRVLKTDGRYVIVIGNNLVRGHAFESWRYLKEIASTIGFTVECYFISAIINHFIKIPRKERISDDYILVLRK